MSDLGDRMRRWRADYYAERLASVHGNTEFVAEQMEGRVPAVAGLFIIWDIDATARAKDVQARHPMWPFHECHQHAMRELVRELEGDDRRRLADTAQPSAAA